MIGQLRSMTYHFPRLLSYPELFAVVSIKTNMADDSSDEDVDVQNGFLEELEIFLPGDSESDNSDSAGNVGLLRKWSDGR